MQYFIFIMTGVILPVFLQIGIGFLCGKLFHAKSETLVTLQIYILIPAIIFVKMYEFGTSGILFIVLHSILLFFGLYLIAWCIAKKRQFSSDKSKAFINSICYFNSGNFCIPLIQTLYTDPIAMSTQIIIMVSQNILTSTVGVYTSAYGKWTQCIKEMLRIPMFYAAIAGALFHSLKVPIYEPIYRTLNGLADTMVPIALITLGIQLSVTKSSSKDKDLALACFMRLIFAPIFALIIGKVLHVDGIQLQVLCISSAAPTAVNAVLLAIKYNREPEFSSKVALLTTVLSSITVAIVILLATA